jgi:predicted ATPase
MRRKIISSVKIDGFKSIKNCDVALRDLNVIIGSTGGGKTNFIEFFHFLSMLLAGKLQEYVEESGGADEILRFGRYVTPRMSAEITLPSERYGFSLEASPDGGLVFAEEFVDGGKFGTLSIGSGHREALIRDCDAETRGLIFRAFDFKDMGRDAPIRRPQPIQPDDWRIARDARNLAPFLYYMRENHNFNYNRIIRRLKILAPYFVDFYLEPDADGGTIELRWLEHGCDTPLSASRLSDGTLLFASLLAVLRDPVKDDMILWDEPDLYLHPTGLGIFANMLQIVRNYVQIVISTNSSEMLDKFEIEDVIVADRGAGYTFPYRVDRDDIDEWAEHCTLSQIWANGIIGGRPMFTPGDVRVKRSR